MRLVLRRARLPLVALADVRGERDRRSRAAGFRVETAHALHEHVAVLARHADVADDDVGLLGAHGVEALARRTRGRYARAAALEDAAHHLAHVVLVLDDENAHAREHRRLP